MRIERVNDSTIKFFLTYTDIESRGFNKEDLWMNRQRGEEFFWTIMDEVNSEQTEDFSMDGPLWIQVHAFDKGIEVVVSKSQQEQDSYGMESYSMNFENRDLESYIDKSTQDRPPQVQPNRELDVPVISEPLTVRFRDFEDLIKYTHETEHDETTYEDLLYVLDGRYYYQMYFDYRTHFDHMEGIETKLLEYSEPTQIASAYLEEYGKIIMSNNVRAQVRRYFQEK
ncbi:adaptor protein MecA [Jeotgalicoccus marinus]|uniref:adaptor protein MecA n=1 Tax=Jeotgalicoccus marinus TaxID=516700 RepID=UPI000404DCD1|nr:adaptor protein MecA [Jeotgalicoccus marinus]